MLPIARAVPSAPSVSAAMVETTSSGALVPKPMMSAPVTTVETCSRAATCAAPSTKRSAAMVRPTRPTTSRMKFWATTRG